MRKLKMRTKTDEIANVFEIFKNKEFGNLTLLEKDNEPWFIAKEIADILEYNQTSDMTRRLDTDEKAITPLKLISVFNLVLQM